MSGTGTSWWLDGDKRWRRGTPPAGWTQGPDGRWHPPSDAQHQTTEELVVIGASWCEPAAAGPPTPPLRSSEARHLTSGRSRSGRPSLPLWMNLAIPVLAAVIVVVAVAGVLTVAGDARDTPDPADEVAGPATRPNAAPPTTASAPGSTAPTDAVADPAGEATSGSSSPTGPATTTPPAMPTTTPTTTSTTGAASPGPSDPLAACSTGQRNVIERGNHPWEWYVARFDEDGDGILCT